MYIHTERRKSVKVNPLRTLKKDLRFKMMKDFLLGLADNAGVQDRL